jgi:hypothetical protein
MSCHSRHGFKSTTRLVVALTGADRHDVESHLHGLRSEATGADLPAPTQADIDQWYQDSINALDDADLPTVRKDALAQALMRARFEDPAPDGRDFYVQRSLMARTLQQELIKSTPGMVDLAAPGSQRDQYELAADGRPAKVWYLSFGSNLYSDRFSCYVQGGSPNGGKTTYSGCRDTTPPEADIPVALPGVVHYAGESLVWGGGVAFLDTESKGKSLGRAYKVTAEQFDDIVFQESTSGSTPTGAKVDLNSTIDSGRTVGKGRYGTLVHVGDYDGAPVFTFTGPFAVRDSLRGNLVYTPDNRLALASERAEAQAVQRARQDEENSAAAAEHRKPETFAADWPIYSNHPSDGYQGMIGGGLAETFDLSPAQVKVYLGGAPGYVR